MSSFFERPSTASERPSTSSGRRMVTSASLVSDSGPDLEKNNLSSIISREVGNDNFLRIANYDKFQQENKAMLAAEQGDLQTLQTMISQHYPITCYRGLNGYTLLHHAASKGHALLISEIVKINDGIDLVNIPNTEDETPLHLAVYANNIHIVDQLLDYGANINAINKDHETPLFYAMRKNNPAMVRLLIRRGADRTITDNYGETAADHAMDHSIVQHMEETLSIMKLQQQQQTSQHLRCNNNNNHNNVLSTLTISTTHRNNHNHNHNTIITDILYHIFSYLTIHELMIVANVSSKWQLISEQESLWKALGIRKWEVALQHTLGFSMTPTAAIFRPRRHSHNNNHNIHHKQLSSANTQTNNNNKSSRSNYQANNNNNNNNNSRQKMIIDPL
jgi:hypothetical protein